VLIGREAEQERVQRALQTAREGGSDALLVRGEPGIGKTALLLEAIAAADGMTVLKARGLEAESQLPFAGLAELCAPIVALRDRLPAAQSAALAGALQLESAEPQARLAIGAALLGLLAHGDLAPGIDALELVPLGDEHTRALLGPLPEPVARRVLATAAGNPLALREIPALLSREELEGRAPIEGPLPPGSTLERVLARRLGALPDETRRALLVAAAGEVRRDDAEATAAAADAIALGERRRIPLPAIYAKHALAILAEEPGLAIERLEAVRAEALPGNVLWAPHLLDAYARGAAPRTPPSSSSSTPARSSSRSRRSGSPSAPGASCAPPAPAPAPPPSATRRS
jgi:AAA ATPase domain